MVVARGAVMSCHDASSSSSWAREGAVTSHGDGGGTWGHDVASS